MAAELLQAQIDIAAPPSKVWALISDFKRMPEWSPQCRLMKPLGAVKPGTRTFNMNRRGMLFWPTTCTVTEVEPDRKLAFKVDANGTTWSYELEATKTGTRLVESRRAPNGMVSTVSRVLTDNVLGGTDDFEVELVEGMNTSLARIKAAAER
ncbi:polyketide cyclase [Mycolicibacterium insubricum]|uniref:Polyketide cyclase n=1 Tax=Mycolicibacterium insubricum TaxID=444597 RepID=A0A1X0DCJ0_9MYCO|nr:SRPBCC family protein [Mycolicibacterium insubricum]MCB9438685.1 SRPBCC family protein [Mycolicibacterium sp.]MCV7080863.1 SRPBCC family protein [Mycolicibacterium insubricum]ORA70101.1 polyketide cyclase [Mycolicibacterium insubricum]BBZ68643.1 polyketide cyclase [Mycolicibacterium insubricum]